MDALFWILGASVLISLVSLIGVVSLGMKKEFFERIVPLLVAFAAGGLLGGALFHLLGESLEEMAFDSAALLLMVGFSLLK